MKRITLFLSAAALIFSSCQAADKNEFIINGKLNDINFEGKTVYLQEFAKDWRNRTNIDSAIVTNGEFSFRGMSKGEPIIHMVTSTTDNDRKMASVIIEGGTIELSIDSAYTVGGTRYNNIFQELNAKMDNYSKERRAISSQLKASTDPVASAELEKQLDKLSDDSQATLFAFVEANIETQVGAYFLTNIASGLTLDQIKELTAKVAPQYKEFPGIKGITGRIPALEATKIGVMFSDINGKTLDNKDAALSDYAGKGKYVLVDFWASWCGPCRQDMPNLVKIYEEYKDKGFEIVGVSLDNNADHWAKGTEDLGVIWPQFSDLKGWKSDVNAVYGIASIPHTVLLDKEGKIIARGLHSKAVRAKLEELLK